MATTPLVQIERTEIDGVPVFWTPVDGPRMASLMFRVGRADEPAHQCGITHLVEHLALAPLTQQPYNHNGFVSAIRTAFHASGTDDQLVEFMHTVVASLRSLPAERTLMERRILLQEAAGRAPGASGLLRWFRHGFRGQGLIGAEEIGLYWLGPEPIQAWAAEWLTAENAAVWWSGPPPSGLRLELPHGERKAVAETPVIPGLEAPARTDLGGTGTSTGFLGSRSTGTRILLDILTVRLRQELRFERGLIYDVGADYEPVGADVATISVGMDCRREDAPEVAGRVLGTLEELRDSGPTVDEIAREAGQFAESAQHPPGHLGFLDSTAHDELLGRTREDAQTIVEQYLNTTPDQVRAAAATALETAILFAPPGPYDERIHAYPAWSADRITGRTIRPTGWLVGPRARKDRLVIGREGVSWISPEGGANTVRFDECVALRHWDGPIRELWGADGFRVVVNAAAWRGGAAVVEEIDRAVDPTLVACGEHGIGALEDKATPGVQG